MTKDREPDCIDCAHYTTTPGKTCSECVAEMDRTGTWLPMFTPAGAPRTSAKTGEYSFPTGYVPRPTAQPKRRLIIGLTGRARVGKDTAARYLRDVHGFAHESFAEPLRRFVCEITGIDRANLDAVKEDVIDWIGKSPRQMMQTLGTEWGRGLVHPKLWVNSLIRRVTANGLTKVVVSDVRFDNEARAILDSGGIVVRIERDAAKLVDEHASEAGVSPSLVDYTIRNDGPVESMYRNLDSICRIFA